MKLPIPPPPDTLEVRVNSICCTLDDKSLCVDTWHILATYQTTGESCPFCECQNLAQHSWSQSTYTDAPFEDKKIRITIKRPRFRCKHCQRTLTPAIPGIVEGHRVTERMVTFMQYSLFLSPSIRKTAKNIGVQPKTVTAILKELVEELRLTVETPTNIGIHEIVIHKKNNLVISLPLLLNWA